MANEAHFRGMFKESFLENIDVFWGLAEDEVMKYHERQLHTTDNTEDQMEYLNRVGLSYAKQRGEGDKTDTDSASESYKTILRPVFIGKRVSFTIELSHQDKTNLVQEVMTDQRMVMQDTEEAAAASIYNTATSNTLPAEWGRTGGDTVSWFNTAHPIQNGASLSNTSSAYRDLTTNNVQNLLDKMRSNKNDANRPRPLMAKKMITSNQKYLVGKQVAGSMLVAETGDNKKNVIQGEGVTEGVVEYNPFITNPNFWMLCSNIPPTQGMIFENNMMLQVHKDFASDEWTMYHVAGQMFAVGVINWRIGWGHA